MVSASFKEPIQFDSLVATFRSSPFVIHEVPIVTFPWWRGIKTDVGLHGNGTSSAVLGSGTGGLAGTSPIVIQRATKLGVLAFQIITIGFHLDTGRTNWNTVRSDQYTVVIFSFLGITKVEVDERDDRFLLAEPVHGHRVMSRVQEERNGLQIGRQRPETEVCFTEAMGIML